MAAKKRCETKDKKKNSRWLNRIGVCVFKFRNCVHDFCGIVGKVEVAGASV